VKYRLLEAGEKIQAGDEFSFPNSLGVTKWQKTNRDGNKVYTSGVYRRPIKKKKGSK